MKTKKQKAEFLFSEIGNIDDSFVAETLAPIYTQTNTRRITFRRLAAAAACVVVAVFLLFTVVIPAYRSFTGSSDRPGLIETLGSASKTASVQSVSDIDFFGKPCVVWQTEPDGEYSVVTVSVSQLASLSECCGDGSRYGGEEVPAGIWLLAGDGTCVTPYLASSAGNVGFNELFEYSPEITPSAGFVDRLSAFIGG